MKTLWKLLAAAGTVFALAAAPALAQERVKVGVSGGDGEIIWAKVKEVAKRQGLEVDVVVFNDYLLPNAALDAGDLDANAFQHKPFLENQIKTRGYKIVPIGDTIVAPIGLYSAKVKKLAELEPQFIRYGRNDAGAEKWIHVDTLADAQGIYFTCPVCADGHMVGVTFRGRGVPDDLGSSDGEKPTRWAVEGTGFADLTLSPSIDLTRRNACTWHGWVRGGSVT